MQRIVSKAERIRNEKIRLKNSVICNSPKKSDHCLNYCRHGKLHEKDTEKHPCHSKFEVCALSKAGIIKVKCKKLTKKEIKGLLNDCR